MQFANSFVKKKKKRIQNNMVVFEKVNLMTACAEVGGNN